ncbi:GNAT family N-acetyltransferase [Peristeroidobacter soli]|uniref:GNAT family N-acetyltransferase n=1 Tax=Peristeroidobacter soli TaxID=2497877 RepID=UPI00101D18D3|nr:GNAT family protein [Peristeroidobacter soli]
MKEIETERLVLRNFRKHDTARLFEYLHEPVASRFLSLALNNMSQTEAEAERRGGGDEHIAICLKESDRLIGDLFAVPEEDTFCVRKDDDGIPIYENTMQYAILHKEWR